jgi:hypothetical protein
MPLHPWVKLLSESDYPHSDSNWPHSRKVGEEVFLDLPDNEVHQFAEVNVRRLYNFPDPDPTTIHSGVHA